MKTRFIRNFLKNTAYCLIIFSQLVILFSGFNVFFTENYNASDEVQTYVILNTIAMCLHIIRWIIKPEYKPSFTDYAFNRESFEDRKCSCGCGEKSCNNNEYNDIQDDYRND